MDTSESQPPKKKRFPLIAAAVVLVLLFSGIAFFKFGGPAYIENLNRKANGSSTCLYEVRDGLLLRLEANVRFVSLDEVELTAPYGCTPFKHRARIAQVGDPYDNVIAGVSDSFPEESGLYFATVFYVGDWVKYFELFDRDKHQEALQHLSAQGTREEVLAENPDVSLANALVTFYGTQTIYFYQDLPYIQSIFLWQ